MRFKGSDLREVLELVRSRVKSFVTIFILEFEFLIGFVFFGSVDGWLSRWIDGRLGRVEGGVFICFLSFLVSRG